MKIVFLIAALATAPALLHADEKLDAKKATVTQNLDKRIESLQNMKTCVAGAATDEAMKACRKAHHSEMEALKEANIDMRIQKLQEKKAKHVN